MLNGYKQTFPLLSIYKILHDISGSPHDTFSDPNFYQTSYYIFIILHIVNYQKQSAIKIGVFLATYNQLLVITAGTSLTPCMHS